MKLQRIGDRKLMLSGSRLGVRVLRSVLVASAVGLYMVGFVTVVQIVWLGVLLLVVASIVAIPANALMRAQLEPLRRFELEGVRRRARGGR